MQKRLIAAPLWAIAVLVTYELAWSLVGVPRDLGPVLALAAAAFVGLDPLGLFWPRLALPAAGRDVRGTAPATAH